MTEKQLASKYTEPDPVMAEIRAVILRDIEAAIVLANQQKNHDRRNGLVFAANNIRMHIGQDGRILKEDLHENLTGEMPTV